MPTRRWVRAIVVLAAVVAGCTAPPTATLDDPRADVTTAPEVAPAPDSAPVAPESGPAPDPPDDSGSCTDEDRTALVAVVDGQLAAIARQDWASALQFATDGFRDGIDEGRFRDIITDGFPVVADNRARDIGPCRAAGDAATLEVTVTDGEGAQQLLLYLFEREADGWGIGGATPTNEAPAGPDEPVLSV